MNSDNAGEATADTAVGTANAPRARPARSPFPPPCPRWPRPHCRCSLDSSLLKPTGAHEASHPEMHLTTVADRKQLHPAAARTRAIKAFSCLTLTPSYREDDGRDVGASERPRDLRKR